MKPIRMLALLLAAAALLVRLLPETRGEPLD